METGRLRQPQQERDTHQEDVKRLQAQIEALSDEGVDEGYVKAVMVQLGMDNMLGMNPNTLRMVALSAVEQKLASLG